MIGVYGITSSRRVPDVAGVRLRVVRGGGVSAIVRDVRHRPTATPHQLRRYHRVVAAIAGQLPSLLPVRFGTVMTETELTAILTLRGPSLQTKSRHVRGRIQMTIRIPDAADGSAAPGRARRVAQPMSPRSAVTGTEYLEARAAAVAAEREIPGFGPVRSALRRWVRDERVDRTRGVTSVYHLVPRGAVNAYTRAAVSALAKAGIRGVLSGPFPPYAFMSW